MSVTKRLEYEKAFADMVGAHGARATVLGRQALAVLLKAVGVQPGDKVGVCAFTCLSVIEAVIAAGARPFYLDVDETLCIAPESILKLKTDALKVILLQHTFGNPGKLDRLLNACKTVNAIVLEDCAHALGCTWKGTPLGQFGLGAIYSFQLGKPYTTGQGGMITVNSEQLLRNVDAILSEVAVHQSFFSSVVQEIQRSVFSLLCGTPIEVKLRHVVRSVRRRRRTEMCAAVQDWVQQKGYVQRLGYLTAKAGLRQLKKWPDTMNLRRRNTALIEQLFLQHDIPLWPKQEPADITYLRYPVRVSRKAELLNEASELSLDMAGWYCSPVHPLETAALAEIGYCEGMAPDAEECIQRVVHLPTGHGATSAGLQSMVRLLAAQQSNKES